MNNIGSRRSRRGNLSVATSIKFVPLTPTPVIYSVPQWLIKRQRAHWYIAPMQTHKSGKRQHWQGPYTTLMKAAQAAADKMFVELFEAHRQHCKDGLDL